MSIETYQGLTPSYERATSLVPGSYLPAYQWFLSHEGEVGPRPWKDHAPKDMPITLVAQRGIHKPGGQDYAISITIANPTIYGADSVHLLDDSTWMIQYCEHHHNTGRKPCSPRYNQALINCLEDGVPVGVFYKTGNEYQCLGLAFLESYNNVAGIFTLHGPVHKLDSGALSPISAKEIEDALENAAKLRADVLFNSKTLDLDYLGSSHEGKHDFTSLKRELKNAHGETFKMDLIEAYNGQCAISGYDALPALDATYLSSYLGAASNTPSAGILLRTDLGALYQQSLISIRPDTYEVTVSGALRNTAYNHFDRRRISLPSNEQLWPSKARLEAHHSSFMQLNC